MKSFDIEALNISNGIVDILKRNNINKICELFNFEEINFRSLGENKKKELRKLICEIKNKNYKNLINRFTDEGDFHKENIKKLIILNRYKNKSIKELFNTSKKKISKIKFLNLDDSYVDDLNLDDLNYSIRVKNVLNSYKIKNISDILDLKINKFNSFKNLGEKSKEELLDDIIRRMKIIYKDTLEEKQLEKQLEEEKLSGLILEKLRNSYFGLELEELNIEFYEENTIMEILDKLENANKVEIKYEKYFLKNISLKTWINNLKDIEKQVVEYMSKGETLESTGQKIKKTRERVRQIEKRIFSKKCCLSEDKYSSIIKKYNITKECFVFSFSESDICYYYLKKSFKIGNLDERLILEEKKIPLEIRERAKKIIYKDYLSFGNNMIKKDSKNILFYILEKKVSDSKKSEEISKIYNKFLEDNNLNDENFYLKKKYFSSTLSNQKLVICKLGKSLRYYDCEKIEESDLIENLDLKLYKNKNIIISSKKLFNDNIEYMKEIDIRDEYELHNLLKKVLVDTQKINIFIERMPHIRFGVITEEKQLLEFLKLNSPVDIKSFSELYESEYGIKSETTNGKIFNTLGKYIINKTLEYKNIESLSGPEIETIKIELTKDNYAIEDFKYIIDKIVGEKIVITKYLIDKLGYNLVTGWTYSKKYKNLETYFKLKIMEKNVFNYKDIKPKFSIQMFDRVRTKLLEEFEILEFQPYKYFNFRRLNYKKITKQDLKIFSNNISKYVGNEIFTIEFLKNKGFDDSLFDLGFENWFYERLISLDKRFKYKIINNTIILKKGDEEIDLYLLIKEILIRYRSIDVEKLLTLLKKEYKINLKEKNIYDIKSHEEFYYNEIMGKIYIDYDTYLENIKIRLSKDRL